MGYHARDGPHNTELHVSTAKAETLGSVLSPLLYGQSRFLPKQDTGEEILPEDTLP